MIFLLYYFEQLLNLFSLEILKMITSEHAREHV